MMYGLYALIPYVQVVRLVLLLLPRKLSSALSTAKQASWVDAAEVFRIAFQDHGFQLFAAVLS